MSIGTKDDPWRLSTPPGSSAYEMYRDQEADPNELICQVGSTKLVYLWRAVEDLHTWLIAQGDWVLLGASDEKKDPAPGTVEAFGRATDNPVGGWYGLREHWPCAVGRIRTDRPHRHLRVIRFHGEFPRRLAA